MQRRPTVRRRVERTTLVRSRELCYGRNQGSVSRQAEKQLKNVLRERAWALTRKNEELSGTRVKDLRGAGTDGPEKATREGHSCGAQGLRESRPTQETPTLRGEEPGEPTEDFIQQRLDKYERLADLTKKQTEVSED